MKLKTLFLLCIAFQSGWCQPKVGYWLEAEVARIPFEVVNNSLFVKVNLNEHKELSFLIDTGSSFSVIFTDSLLQVPVQFRVTTIQGFGKMDSLTAHISVYNTLSMGALTSYGQQILVVEKDKVGFQQFFDRPLHGIIGLDVLKNYDLEFNFSTSKLIMRKHSMKDRKNKKWTKLPFEISNNTLLVSATISSSQKKGDSVQLVLDTGAELPLLLQERFCPPTSLRTIIGLGFLGYASGRIGEIEEIKMGEISVKNLITAFPDSTSVKWDPLLPQQGNLGILFLNRYRININFKENYLQLRQVKRFIRNPPSYNRSGLAVGRHLGKQCGFYIDEIAPGSLAENAGLLKGDIIVSINKIHCSNLSLELISKFTFNETSPLKIQILRGTTFKVLTLDLSEKK